MHLFIEKTPTFAGTKFEQKPFMDRNNYIGLGLMVILLFGYSIWTNNNKAKQLEEEKLKTEQFKKDSLAQVEAQAEQLPIDKASELENQTTDTLQNIEENTNITPKEYYILENEDLRLTFSNYGGRINEAELLKYESYPNYINDTSSFIPLKLYNQEHSKFNWNIDGKNTEDLVYEVSEGPNYIEFTNPQNQIRQRFEFDDANPYLIHYSLKSPSTQDVAKLDWQTNFVLQEHDMRSEREFTFFAYKNEEGELKKIKKAKEEVQEMKPEPIDFIVERQRFFSQTLLGEDLFTSNQFYSKFNRDDLKNIKHLDAGSEVKLTNGNANFDIFIAPNDRSILASVDKKLPNIQPKGIFGLTKAFSWMFNLARPYFVNYGLLILTMTLIIKLILTPLTYRSYLSQAKMAVLKPELEELKAKYPDDQAKYSQEQMKLYNKAGVNPLGGCLPSLIQLPIFFSLYYFFRTSIFFRQKKFLWAEDLSTYDEFIHLPFKLPFLGDHISLFAVLYGVALFFSMRMNKGMMSGGLPSAPPSNKKDGGDMQQMMQTQMKFMQYAMPVFLPVIFNSFPAALTFYYFCYNMINALQTWAIKTYIIDEDKIHKQIQENKAKPKKQSGFRKRLEDAMKMQQELAAQQAKQKKSK